MAQKIGDLFFELGLDDKKLKGQWDSAVKKYEKKTLDLNLRINPNSLKAVQQQLKSLNLSSLAKQLSQMEGAMRSFVAAATKLSAMKGDMRDIANATGTINANLKGMPGNVGRVNTGLTAQKGIVDNLLTQAKRYVSIWGAVSLTKSIIRITGEIEYQRRALESVMQNAQKANEIWGQIQQLAVKSPFQVGDLLKYSKQLSAFGIENEHLFDTLKRLADVSAGLGVDLSRIALAYGEINAATVLRGKETRQLTQAGIPIIRELAKTFSELEGRMVSAGEVYKRIFSRQVSFEMVKKVFEDLTNEGGKFYQMQEKQAATLKGSIKNIADQWTLMANQIGESNSGWLKSLVQGLKSAMASWQNWIGIIKTGFMFFASGKVVQQVTIWITNLGAAMAGTAKSTSALIGSYTSLATILAMLVVALYKYATRLSEAEKIQKVASDTTKEWAATQDSIITELDYLYAKLRNATKGTKEYEEAEKAIIRAYPEYFDRLRAEGKEIGDLTQHYASLRDTALEAARARTIESATAKAGAAYSAAIGDLINPDNITKLRAWGKDISKAESVTLLRYITGQSVSNSDLLSILGLTSANKWNEEDVIKTLYNYSSRPTARRRDEYTSLPKDIITLIKYRETYLASNKAYKETLEAIAKGLSPDNPLAVNYEESPDFVGPVLDKNKIPLDEWQKKTREILTKWGLGEKGSAGALWVDEATNLNDYIESLGKIKKGLETQIDNFTKTYGADAPETKETQNRLNAINEMVKTYGWTLDKSGSSGNSKADQAVRDAIHVIDEQLQWVEKVREFYRKLKEHGLSPEEAQRIVEGVFGTHANLPTGMTFSTALLSDNKAVLTAFKDLYKQIGTPEALKASENMQQRITADEAKEKLDILNAQKKLQDDLKEWGAQDFVIEGESGLEKLSKLMAELSTKQNKLALKREEKLAEARRLYTGEALKEQERLIDDLYNKEKQYNIDVAQQRVDSFGEAFAKQASKELNIAFKNAGKKSLGDLREALDKFSKTASKDFGLFGEGAKAEIIKGGVKVGSDGKIDWNSLGGLSEEELTSLLDNSNLNDTQKENLRVLYKAVKEGQNLNRLVEAIAHSLGVDLEAAKNVYTEQEKKLAISPLFDSLSQIGGVIGGTTGNVVSNLASFGKTAATLYTNYKAGKGATTAEYISMGIQGLVGAYSAISAIIKKNKQTMREWRDAIQQATQAARMNAIEQKAYKQSNVWGVESPYKRIQAAAAQYVESQKQLNKAAQDLIEKGKYKKGIKKVMDADTTVGITAGTTVAGAAAGTIIGSMASGAAAGSIVPGYGTLIGAAVGLVAGIITSIFSKKKTPKYKELTDIYGAGNIYDPKTFELNQQIINDYAKMNDETKKLIDNWEEIKDKMKEAKEEMESRISELTGNLGDDIKDMLVQAFSDGDIYASIDDIDEYLGNLIKNLALQSAYAAMFENVFNTLQDRMMKSFDIGGDQEIADDILWLRDELPKYVKGFGQVLEVLQDELDKVGIDTDLTGGGSTSSSAISGVTEETASRLLGQINAIRADVSVKRAMLEAYLPHIGTINDTMAGGLATLKEIEVNTRRGADISGEIRDLINSMMGVSNTGAGYALNVNIG